MAEKSDEQMRKEVQECLQEIERSKEEAKRLDLAFWSLTEEELLRKVRGESSNSPFIFMTSWSLSPPPGSFGTFSLSFSNPDPTNYGWVFVTLFFGLASLAKDIALGWAGRDTRWPAISTRPFNLPSGTTHSETIKYPVPSGLPSGTYLGTGVLWLSQFNDRGTLFERAMFDVIIP
jgi:hypothetical protein